MQIAWQITINRHPELVSGSVPPFIRGSTRLPYCIFVILVRGKSGMQKKARQVLEGPAEGGLRNEVEQWRRMPVLATKFQATLQAPHTGNARQQRSRWTAKPSAAVQKNTGINFGLRSQVNTSDKPAVSRNRKLNSLRSFRSNACFQPYLPSAAPKIDSQLFGIVSKEKLSTCKFTSIIVEYIQRTFRKNLPTFLL